MSLNISITGTLPSILSFVANLRSTPRLITLSTFEVALSGKGPINVSLPAVAYVASTPAPTPIG